MISSRFSLSFASVGASMSAVGRYLPLAFGFLKFSIHMALWQRFGIHRDEYYFFECARRLDWGYVDHAPFVPMLAGLALLLPGPDLFWLRFFPALGGGIAVAVAVLLARDLGGKTLAQLLTGISMLIAGVYLRTGGLLHLPSFEPMFWITATWLALRAVRREKSQLWLLVGPLTGVGLLNKHTMAIWGLGLILYLLATPAGRGQFKSPFLYAGGVIAALLFAPNIFWQIANDLPTFEFVRRIGEDVTAKISPIAFLLGQLLYIHPLNAILWIGGLVFLLAHRDRALLLPALIFLPGLAIFLLLGGKPYYLAPAYPALLAAGGVALETRRDRSAARGRRARMLIGYGLPALLIAGGIALAPLSLPILPVAKTDAVIAKTLGWIVGKPEDLSGEFHDQFGWREQAGSVARVYATLSPAERAKTLVLTHNYGQAGAVDYFRRRGLDLPPALSGHMNYFLWGPERDGRRGDIVISVDIERETLAAHFKRIEGRGLAASHPNARKSEQDNPIFIARQPRTRLDRVWSEYKQYGFRGPRHASPGSGASANGKQ